MNYFLNFFAHPLRSILSDLNVNEKLVNGTQVLLFYYVLVITFFLIDVYIDHNVNRSEDIDVDIEYLDENHIKVNYKDGKAVTPGQACVIYLGEECLMGGIIKQVFKDGKELWYLK